MFREEQGREVKRKNHVMVHGLHISRYGKSGFLRIDDDASYPVNVLYVYARGDVGTGAG